MTRLSPLVAMTFLVALVFVAPAPALAPEQTADVAACSHHGAGGNVHTGIASADHGAGQGCQRGRVSSDFSAAAHQRPSLQGQGGLQRLARPQLGEVEVS
jgi:hypothetical protein